MIRMIRSIYVILLLVLVRSSCEVLFSCDPNAVCGCSSNPALMTRIFGGEVAGVGTWDWAVSLSVNKIDICGGSILSSSWIITAAHCRFLSKYRNAIITVYAGTNMIWSGSQNRTVSQMILHPKYDDYAETYEYDIALLKLSEPLNMSDPNLTPICLPNISSTNLAATEWPPADMTVVAVGWGFLANGGELPSNLQQVTLQTVDNQAASCRRVINNTQLQFCASVPSWNKDTCGGDSGGPLMMFTPSNQWVLVGLTSYGDIEGCAQVNYSAVYTRVTAFKDWIESHTNDSHWISVNSHANSIVTSIHRLFFFLIPGIFLRIFFQ